TGTASRYVDRGLLNGVEYRYVVRAVDAAGKHPAGVAAGVTPRPPPRRSRARSGGQPLRRRRGCRHPAPRPAPFTEGRRPPEEGAEARLEGRRGGRLLQRPAEGERRHGLG